jgi:hypothetical protein
LFATVSCECTRKARAPGVLRTSRLPIADGAGEVNEGSGDELDMINQYSSGRRMMVEIREQLASRYRGGRIWDASIVAGRRVAYPGSSGYVVHSARVSASRTWPMHSSMKRDRMFTNVAENASL